MADSTKNAPWYNGSDKHHGSQGIDCTAERGDQAITSWQIRGVEQEHQGPWSAPISSAQGPLSTHAASIAVRQQVRRDGDPALVPQTALLPSWPAHAQPSFVAGIAPQVTVSATTHVPIFATVSALTRVRVKGGNECSPIKTLKLVIFILKKFWLQIWFQKYYISPNATQFLINEHKNKGRFLFTGVSVKHSLPRFMQTPLTRGDYFLYS